MFKRIFLIVMDGVGVGEAPDAEKFGDKGANTLLHAVGESYNLNVLEKFGLLDLIGKEEKDKRGLYMKARPMNAGKDSLNGHYELMGAITRTPYKTYPDGFPLELISKIQHETGYDVIGNGAANGEEIINELGEMQVKNKALIVYTSADSVLQIAAHEDVIPVEELYRICEIVREITKDPIYNISRIIARPFVGKVGKYTRTNKRRDYALDPPINVLDLLYKNGVQTICVGKINDLFNGKSISAKIKATDNVDTLLKVVDFAKGNFEGLLFANLNDFDSKYGHRRDREGFLKALEEFNFYLPIIIKNLKKDDLLIITADHGNDPTYKGSDHTREYIPILMYSPIFKKSKKLEDRDTFADVGATILDNFNIKNEIGFGHSVFDDLREENASRG